MPEKNKDERVYLLHSTVNFFTSTIAVFTHLVCTILSSSQICFRSYRYAGYEQYTWWIYNRFGKGMRKVIPSCAIWALRNSFLSENHENDQ